jgi:hypothetical protein
MRSPIYKIIVGVAAVLALAACEPKDTASPGTTTETPAATEKQNGDVIDVNAILLDQGFKQGHIGAVEKNAAYWLTPFQTPLEMSQNPTPGNVTCTFMMVHKDYKKGDAYADHPIMENSWVQLTGFVVGSDGVAGASLPKMAKIQIGKLSPTWLAAADKEFGGGLGVCGDLTVR